MISLGYLMLFLMGLCPFSNIYYNEDISFHEKFELIKEMKKNMKPSDYCNKDKNKYMLEYMEEVLSLGFDEEPHYGKLRFCLEK